MLGLKSYYVKENEKLIRYFSKLHDYTQTFWQETVVYVWLGNTNPIAKWHPYGYHPELNIFQVFKIKKKKPL